MATQEYRSRKRARLQKRIEEQLRTAAQSHSDTLGAHTASALTELLQSFGGSSLGGDILAKGTRFTHTEKFTFTQVIEELTKPAPKTLSNIYKCSPFHCQSESSVCVPGACESLPADGSSGQLPSQLASVGGGTAGPTAGGAGLPAAAATAALPQPRGGGRRHEAAHCVHTSGNWSLYYSK